MNFKLSLASLSLLSASLFSFLPSASAAAISFTETYYFTGTCTDCTGTGQGTLVLQNYTPGTALKKGNFFSFNYTSNLLPAYNFTGDTISFFRGNLGATPGSYSLLLVGKKVGEKLDFFDTSTGGGWCTGKLCGADYGTLGKFTPQGTPAAVTPEPATISLLGTGIAALVTFRRRRRS